MVRLIYLLVILSIAAPASCGAVKPKGGVPTTIKAKAFKARAKKATTTTKPPVTSQYKTKEGCCKEALGYLLDTYFTRMCTEQKYGKKTPPFNVQSFDVNNKIDLRKKATVEKIAPIACLLECIFNINRLLNLDSTINYYAATKYFLIPVRTPWEPIVHEAIPICAKQISAEKVTSVKANKFDKTTCNTRPYLLVRCIRRFMQDTCPQSYLKSSEKRCRRVEPTTTTTTFRPTVTVGRTTTTMRTTTMKTTARITTPTRNIRQQTTTPTTTTTLFESTTEPVEMVTDSNPISLPETDIMTETLPADTTTMETYPSLATEGPGWVVDYYTYETTIWQSSSTPNTMDDLFTSPSEVTTIPVEIVDYTYEQITTTTELSTIHDSTTTTPEFTTTTPEFTTTTPEFTTTTTEFTTNLELSSDLSSDSSTQADVTTSTTPVTSDSTTEEFTSPPTSESTVV